LGTYQISISKNIKKVENKLLKNNFNGNKKYEMLFGLMMLHKLSVVQKIIKIKVFLYNIAFISRRIRHRRKNNNMRVVYVY
jgi:hypothetical protein